MNYTLTKYYNTDDNIIRVYVEPLLPAQAMPEYENQKEVWLFDTNLKMFYNNGWEEWADVLNQITPDEEDERVHYQVLHDDGEGDVWVEDFYLVWDEGDIEQVKSILSKLLPNSITSAY